MVACMLSLLINNAVVATMLVDIFPVWLLNNSSMIVLLFVITSTMSRAVSRAIFNVLSFALSFPSLCPINHSPSSSDTALRRAKNYITSMGNSHNILAHYISGVISDALIIPADSAPSHLQDLCYLVQSFSFLDYLENLDLRQSIIACRTCSFLFCARFLVKCASISAWSIFELHKQRIKEIAPFQMDFKFLV